MFATLDHLDIARRAAPRTSLPGLILAPGDVSEVESATLIVFLNHFTCRFPDLSVSCTVYERTAIVEPSSTEKIVIMPAARRILNPGAMELKPRNRKRENILPLRRMVTCFRGL